MHVCINVRAWCIVRKRGKGEEGKRRKKSIKILSDQKKKAYIIWTSIDPAIEGSDVIFKVLGAKVVHGSINC